MIRLEDYDKRIIKKYKWLLEENDVSAFFSNIFSELSCDIDEDTACRSIPKIRIWLEEHNIDLLPLCKKRIPGAMFFHSKINTANIPEGVVVISAFAFSECFLLTDVKLPSTLDLLGHRAFYRCQDLPRVNIPEGTTEIWDECFARCTSLKEVYLPSSIKVIYKDVFKGCSPDLKIYCKFNPEKITWLEWKKYKDNIEVVV